MIRWYPTFLGALGFAPIQGTVASAQGPAAKQGGASVSSPLTVFLFIAPVVVILLLLISGLRRSLQQYERAMQINEEILVLARQQAAMQAEANRLLGQLVEILGHNRGHWSSHE